MRNYLFKEILISILFSLFIVNVSSLIFAQEFSGKVLFVTSSSATTDSYIIEKLTSWGFTVEINDVKSEFRNRIPADEELANYKLMFVSEAISSGDLARLRGADNTFTTGWLPIPTVNTDNWCSRVSALGFVSGSSGYGSIDGNVIIVDQTGNTLVAGFAPGTTIAITNGTTSSNSTDQNTYVIPDPSVNVIPIAASVSDQNKLIAFGVEKGTSVFNSSGVNDGSVKTTARYASVGIHALAYPNITEDGWKLIKAAIKWVLETGTDVKENKSLPQSFELSQNYPNPFNPITNISYTIPKESFVKLEVYNLLGKKVATLVNEKKFAGNYTVKFNASDLPSGVYVYILSTPSVSIAKKMMLIK